jgi:RNA polymerase sigma-70 factor (ECF subfamily)
MAELTDEEIAKTVQLGDAEAFGKLIERYEAKMTRYARRFLFIGDDSKDVVQDIFIKAYMNMKSFDATRRFSPWLYRIAHNELVNAMKKRTRSPVFSFDFDTLLPHPTAKETADEQTNQNEIRKLLESSLDKLDAKYKDPLVLYYLEELDYKEIAEVLQIPIATVGVRLKRAGLYISHQACLAKTRAVYEFHFD